MQQYVVSKEIKLQGYANYNRNVRGDFMPRRVIFDEHFIFDPSEVDWVEGESYGGTIAWAAPHTVTLTTGAVQYDEAELSHASTWNGTKNGAMEARVKIDTNTNVAINVGFVDVTRHTSVADNQLCFELTGVALVDSRVANGCAFCFDTDGSTDVWYMVATKASNEGTPVAVLDGSGTAVAPVDDTYATFKVAINTDGDVTYYYNGSPVGFQQTAVTASTAMLPYVSVMSQSTSTARVLTVDRITCWQDE